MNKEELFSLNKSKIDITAEKKAKKHWDLISKPLDGLGEFESLLVKIFSVLSVDEIKELKKALVVMIADNGIVEEGVSQCGKENTLLVAKTLGENRSSASVLAKYAKADCIPVDIGIASDEVIDGVRNYKVSKGTKNFLKEAAMSEDQCLEAIERGIGIVHELKQKGYHIVATGEMGIGNTTTATAVLCALTGISPEDLTGRGAGLSDEGLKRKKEVIKKGLLMHNLNPSDYAGEDIGEYALKSLTSVGGLDIAAMAGLFIGGAVYGVPVVIDGLISSVSALIAEMLLPGCRDYMIPSHSGREKGVESVLKRLELSSYINGNMALGEGTGALMLFPLLDMVLDFYNNATRFEDADIEQYERQEEC